MNKNNNNETTNKEKDQLMNSENRNGNRNWYSNRKRFVIVK